MNDCAKCHGVNGFGIPGSYPPLFQNPVVNQDKSSNLIDVMLLGIPERQGFDAMPSFANKLSDDEMASIANFIRVAWGSPSQTTVTSPDVAEKRKALLR
jgi:mono/diheme cytochrome c family protein